MSEKMQDKVDEATSTAVKEQRRLTMPEDPNTGPGWKWLRFDWFLHPIFKYFVEWHDRVTTQGSWAQKIGIPVWRISKAGKDMLEVLCKNRPWYVQMQCKIVRGVTTDTNVRFYEGPIGEINPPKPTEPPQGEMP